MSADAGWWVFIVQRPSLVVLLLSTHGDYGAEKGKKRCPHLPTVDEETMMLDLRDQILVRTHTPVLCRILDTDRLRRRPRKTSRSSSALPSCQRLHLFLSRLALRLPTGRYTSYSAPSTLFGSSSRYLHPPFVSYVITEPLFYR